MLDERDLSPEKKWLWEEQARLAIANFKRRHINAQYAPGRDEALPLVLSMIPEGATVVRGDSVSLDQLGVMPALTQRNRNTIVDPFARGSDGNFLVGGAKRQKMLRRAFSADVFLTGTNAVTLDGRLVSTDALGNRVAAMIFGPAKVIVVAGMNKLVKDVEEARARIRNIATPINAKRHYLRHHNPDLGDLPCARTGKCIDCASEWRLCCYTVIIESNFPRVKGRLNVVLVGEELGI